MRSASIRAASCRSVFTIILLLCWGQLAFSQEPTPETGNTLYPGGAFVSYGSVFETHRAPLSSSPAASLRPTFAHEGRFTFAWGFHRDFDLMVLVPIETISLHFSGMPSAGGTGLGDTLIAVKYRFLR